MPIKLEPYGEEEEVSAQKRSITNQKSRPRRSRSIHLPLLNTPALGTSSQQRHPYKHRSLSYSNMPIKLEPYGEGEEVSARRKISITSHKNRTRPCRAKSICLSDVTTPALGTSSQQKDPYKRRFLSSNNMPIKEKKKERVEEGAFFQSRQSQNLTAQN